MLLPLPVLQLQGLASSGSLHLANVWATAEAPLIIQRDPTADPTAEPAAVLQWIRVTNCSYVYFKDIVFEAPNAGAGSNVVWISLRYVMNPLTLYQCLQLLGGCGWQYCLGTAVLVQGRHSVIVLMST